MLYVLLYYVDFADAAMVKGNNICLPFFLAKKCNTKHPTRLLAIIAPAIRLILVKTVRTNEVRCS